MRSYFKVFVFAAVATTLGFTTASSTTDATKSKREDCNECLGQMGGGGPGHSFQWGGQGHFEGNHVVWQEGWCDTYHTACEGGGVIPDTGLVANLESAVEVNDVSAIRELLDRNPNELVYNEARSAVHLLNCREEVVAHYPVDLSVNRR